MITMDSADFKAGLEGYLARTGVRAIVLGTRRYVGWWGGERQGNPEEAVHPFWHVLCKVKSVPANYFYNKEVSRHVMVSIFNRF